MGSSSSKHKSSRASKHSWTPNTQGSRSNISSSSLKTSEAERVDRTYGIPQEAPPLYSENGRIPTVADRSIPTASGSNRRYPLTAAYLRAPLRKESQENALETLKLYDTVIIVDDSSSMRYANRWEQAGKALAELAHTAGMYDTDGIDIYFLNNRSMGINMKTYDGVKNLFNSVTPRGITPLGSRLDQLTRAYFNPPGSVADKKPINYVVITDGEPTDDPEYVIRALAQRLDQEDLPLSQLGIQFVQIGDDKEAAAFLKRLDDDLEGVRDIVDTTPFELYNQELTPDMLIKILLGGINRRVDTKGAPPQQ